MGVRRPVEAERERVEGVLEPVMVPHSPILRFPQMRLELLQRAGGSPVGAPAKPLHLGLSYALWSQSDKHEASKFRAPDMGVRIYATLNETQGLKHQ